MEPGTGVGLLLIGVTVLGTIVMLVAIVVASKSGRRSIALGLSTGLLIWLVTYGIVLVGTSLASREQTLTAGQQKYFCGFYLDCHMSVAVINVQQAKMLGSGATQAAAQGNFYIVTVKVGNGAKRETIWLNEPKAVVVDSTGREYGPSAAGLVALGVESNMGEKVTAGSSYTTTLVFDLPMDVQNPRLDVTEGVWIDHAVEFFMIGDEDSALHKRTLLGLKSTN